MPVLHGINERQGDLALFKIAENWFAQLFCRGGKVQEIIDKLKGEARVAPVLRQSELIRAFPPAKDRAEPGATAEQTRGFVRCEPHSILFGYFDAADLGELDQFAFDHLLSQVDEHVQNTKIALLECHLEGLHVEPVAG